MSKEGIIEEQLFVLDEQHLFLADFDTSGWMLVIGGGAVIGRLKDERVIALDIQGDELEEAPAGLLKVVMEPIDLKFHAETFYTVTSFFGLMYISRKDRKKVFQEVHRSLKLDGKFLIWDVVIPPYNEKIKDMSVIPLIITSNDETRENMFVVPLIVTLPEEEIRTVYGIPWKNQEHDLAYYVDLARKTGFKIHSQNENGKIFHLELRKKTN